MRVFLRFILPVIYLGILVIPGSIFFSSHGGVGFTSGLDLQTTATLLFPLFGLYALTLVWFQVMLGSLMPVWKNIYPNIFLFHRAEGVFALLFALTHPTLRFIGIGLSTYLTHITSDVAPGLGVWIFVGYAQLTLMLLTVSTALLMRTKKISRFWRKLHIANYAVFGLAWLHSWFLGSDVQSTNLKWLWIFFAVTVAGAIFTKLALAHARQRRLQAGPQA